MTALRVHASDTGVGLYERAPHHVNRSRRDVVVVPARVVPVRPADEPDVYVLVAVDRGVMPPLPRIDNLIAPQIRAGSQLLKSSASSCRSRHRAGSAEKVIAVTPLLSAGTIRSGIRGAAGRPEAAGPGLSHGSHGGQRRRGQDRDGAAHMAGRSQI